ncbi:MAG TPA: hypothetical protein VGD90_05635 [Sphingobacteriaceae bacterium]
MHIEFSSHFEPELKEIINRLKLDAHLFNSFNVNGETVTLSGEREELEKILEHKPDDFQQGPNGASADHFKKILALVRAHLR